MNLPNKITLTRIFMIPVFVAIFFLDGVLPYNYMIAAIVFAVAACTDFIDGHIARSRGLVTNLGKFLDPIADKVLVSTAMLLMLAIKEQIVFYLGYEWYVVMAVCVCIIMAREFIISAFRQIAATRGLVMAADKLGKYKTTFQDISIFVIIFSVDVNWGAGVVWFGFILFIIATVLTVWSGISYVVKNKQVLKDAD
ncbi:MAG: CDP-diacylglycerol--glycerol-3-phosphate 3-phosphatidyltransferase [Clostridia bacterium]|nr:CDP-diacylglycerol--glycerol-3-phosphate 3-phosphatidyltransferase [Clostridia bacterium]